MSNARTADEGIRFQLGYDCMYWQTLQHYMSFISEDASATEAPPRPLIYAAAVALSE